MTDDIHSCSPYCNRPACVKEQRDKMRDAMAGDDVKMPEPGIDTANHAHIRVIGYTADQMREYADAKCAELRRRVAELEADARRYRWLRDVHEHNIFVTRHVGAPTISRCFGEYLDSLIDKVFAIGAEGGEQ